VLDLIASVAETDATVLIKGESGTGKELVCRAIHARSARRYNPLVVVNCGALAEGVLESELFGHEKGAFTGAQYRHKGKFELADGGTIFLDEIGAVTQRVQVELLRVLEEKVVTRVGGQDSIPADFRVIAATNQDLESMVRAGEFREDLYWRLNVFTIEIPPLRERPQDIPLLAEHFLDRFARAMNRKPLRLSPEALEALKGYEWPGNVRELQNAIERAVVVGSPPTVAVQDLPLRVTDAPARPRTRSLEEVEKAHIGAVLDSCNWNITQAARILEVDRGTLYNRLKNYGLKRPLDGTQ
jgi:transcriptional regulator with GAF, ATPase, and Fis domain